MDPDNSPFKWLLRPNIVVGEFSLWLVFEGPGTVKHMCKASTREPRGRVLPEGRPLTYGSQSPDFARSHVV